MRIGVLSEEIQFPSGLFGRVKVSPNRVAGAAQEKKQEIISRNFIPFGLFRFSIFYFREARAETSSVAVREKSGKKGKEKKTSQNGFPYQLFRSRFALEHAACSSWLAHF